MAVELVAGAFLSSALQVTFDRLASSDIKSYFFGKKNIEGLLNKLHITLLSVNQVLEDAEERQYTKPNVKKWLDELKHLVFVADDLLDEISYEATHQKLQAHSQTDLTSKVKGFFTSSMNQFDREIEGRIQQVLHDLEFLVKQKDALGLKEGFCGGTKVSNRLPSTSLVGDSKIYGRDDDQKEIIKFLLSKNVSEEDISVISIVGMGGLGKTTLAQHVYNDPKVEKQFQLKAWVCVSEEFDVQRITKTILSALGCSITGSEDLNQLQLKLKEILAEKKFLIVLDDVWNQDPTNWEALQVPFLCGASGSKILATTRNTQVASVMQSVQVHCLQLLEEDDGWQLFAKHAFDKKNSAGTYKNDLEPIGRKIVEKCKGLPLAIKSLGSLVLKSLSEEHWRKILESEIWQLPEDKSNIIPALRLSYHYLPSNLKHCFAFSSIYPKDCHFDKEYLIRMWMAEGLVHSYHGNKSLEELGNEFFCDLESRSFFQQSNVVDKYYSMHDLVHDLAKSVLGEFGVQMDGDDKVQDISKRARYLLGSIGHEYNETTLESICECKLLRGWFGGLTITKGKPTLFSRFKYLRLLNLARCELPKDIGNLKHLRFLSLFDCPSEKLPDSICSLHYLQTLNLQYCSSLAELPSDIGLLINLRYLNLTCTGISNLPESICMLHNLHTLSLAYCKSLVELPSNFHKLINLHHLDIVGTRMRDIPQHMGRLRHLRNFSEFIVGKQSGSNMKELGELNNLGSSLVISELQNVEDVVNAREAKMRDKKSLEILRLEWSGNHEDSQNERCVLEALQPHPNLKELSIREYGGTCLVDWLDAPYLPNLVSLKLSKCEYCFSLPPLGQLPSLKHLIIHGFEGIKEIGTEFYGNKSSIGAFRSLETLVFDGMSEWEEWMQCEEGECCFPCLERLSLRSCPKLRNSLPPGLACLKSLSIKECQQLEPSNTEESWLQQILITSPNLENLDLMDCPKLVSFPTIELSAPNLQKLTIEGCCRDERPLYMQTQLPTISSLCFKNCPHLGSLNLHHCPMLESLGGGGFPSSLGYLSIKQCPKLIDSRKQWGLHKLHSLQQFTVSHEFENVECFPEESLLPPNLRDFWLVECSNLKAINKEGLLHLTCLEELYIKDCPSLQCLPEQALPKSLSYIYIRGNCPLLKERYKKENGPAWLQISHISCVSIK